jgi:L-arabinokinase
VLTRAPGRLDCIGGMADYSGTLALQMPTECSVYVAAGRRNDQRVHVESIAWESEGEPSRFDWPLSILYASDGQIITADRLVGHFDGCTWVRHVAGLFLALLESGDVPHFGGGVTLVMKSEIPPAAGLASSAAIQVAVAKAITALFEVSLDPVRVARACRQANEDVAGGEPGLVDHLTCLFGEANALLQIRCQPDDVLGNLALPSGIMFAGVDTQVRLPISRERCADNRAASLMGRYLIERLLESSGAVGDPMGGYLANISPNEYVRRFRNELPVKVKGRDFLDRFGRLEEFDLDIDPDRIYKVRSRTEHHVYENDRAHRLLERLARARRTGERDALVEAGELMYASHWSYGQRCGMGSIETDVLMNLIRERGPARGLYGAKVTGCGCGGTLAVLMADTPAARAALDEACAAYHEKTGKEPAVLIGSSPGALSFGHRELD